MMAICPVCNSFTVVNIICPTCNDELEELGKVTDYLDPYGHYNDNDTLKMADGYERSYEEAFCAHLYYCKTCHKERVEFIKEIKM